jgi:spore coat polysaccharide biosynthesis predicted glycosyltransferase SpsG
MSNNRHSILNWTKELSVIGDRITRDDIVVVDSYHADLRIYKMILKKSALGVFIDDNMRLPYPGGVVVNGTIGAEKFNYDRTNPATYLLGARYIPLRSEFWHARPPAVAKDVRSLLITFGGDDIRNMTPQILRHFEKKAFSMNVIIGPGFKNIASLNKYLRANIRFYHSPDAKTIRSLMEHSDIAVSAGGQTIYELARIGVPTVTVAVADNQSRSVRNWNAAGFAFLAGKWDDNNILKKIEKAVSLMLPKSVRQRRSNAGREIVDGHGALRVVDKVLTMYSTTCE